MIFSYKTKQSSKIFSHPQRFAVPSLVSMLGALSLVLNGCYLKNPELTGPQEKQEQAEAVASAPTFELFGKVDILFVIDHSRSMENDQKKLRENIDQFIDAFTSTSFRLDYHLGVVSIFDSRKAYHNVDDQAKYPLGYLRSFYEGDKKKSFLTSKDGSPEEIKTFLKHYLRVPPRRGPEFEELFAPTIALLSQLPKEQWKKRNSFLTNKLTDFWMRETFVDSIAEAVKGLNESGTNVNVPGGVLPNYGAFYERFLKTRPLWDRPQIDQQIHAAISPFDWSHVTQWWMGAEDERKLTSENNAGFLRPDSHKVIVWLTDADDQTPDWDGFPIRYDEDDEEEREQQDRMSAEDMARVLNDILGQPQEDFSFFGIINKNGSDNNTSDPCATKRQKESGLDDGLMEPSTNPERIKKLFSLLEEQVQQNSAQVSERSHVATYSLCEEYGKFLADMGHSVRERVSRREIVIDDFIQAQSANGSASGSSLRVWLKDPQTGVQIELPSRNVHHGNGWLYDPETWTVSIQFNDPEVLESLKTKLLKKVQEIDDSSSTSPSQSAKEIDAQIAIEFIKVNPRKAVRSK